MTGDGNANILTGNAGSDTLNGEGGNDTLNGGADSDTLNGGTDNDTLNGDAGNDVLSGDDGIDTLNGGSGIDLLLAGAGDDILVGGTGIDTVMGEAGNDTIRHTIGDGGGLVDGGADSDTLEISGGTGNANQTLAVTFIGTTITKFDTGTVTNVESVKADLGAGTDTLTYLAPGGVTVNLSTGTASGFTSIANIENVTGNGGVDSLTGSVFANVLSGGGAADTLSGDAGDDVLRGGAGVDTMTGGIGADIFDFNAMSEPGVGLGNRDVIMDFEAADTIDLGGIPGTFIFIGTAAFTATTANQLRYTLIDTNGDTVNDSTLIQLDNNNNTSAEGEILLQGYTTPLTAAGDFIL